MTVMLTDGTSTSELCRYLGRVHAPDAMVMPCDSREGQERPGSAYHGDLQVTGGNEREPESPG